MDHSNNHSNYSAPLAQAHRLFLALLFALAVTLGPEALRDAAAAAGSTNVSTPLTGKQLLDELRNGGYLLYFRHTATDFSQDDTRSRGAADCDNQRNLTDVGRAQAHRIGVAVRELRIPIGEVLASPLCRTMETARLAFGRATATTAARGGPLQAADAERYAALRALLSAPRLKGANAVIASHGNPFFAIAGPPYLAEGEAAVVRGLGNDRFDIVARIRHDDWQTLAAAGR